MQLMDTLGFEWANVRCFMAMIQLGLSYNPSL